MVSKRLFLLCFSIISIVASCQKEAVGVKSAFYHWQTRLEIDSLESSYLNVLNATRLYVKFFDVVWDEAKQEAIPTANLQIDNWGNNELSKSHIVPTVFITNEVLKKGLSRKPDKLSANIWAAIQRLMPNVKFKEIQFDCDWTLATKDAYFQFLEEFRRQIPKQIQLSATIRLHQYRYPEKTGIPPVHRGMLMFYNMGDVQEWEEPNSILNLEKAKPYFQNKYYPLALDFALPLFRWGVLFREGRMIKLINGLHTERLADTSLFERLTTADSIRYELKKSTYLDGYYLYQGDQLRLEWVENDRLIKAAQLLQSAINTNTFFVSFYHLDAPILERYNYDILQQCLEILSAPHQ